jgi:hypothetical protein
MSIDLSQYGYPTVDQAKGELFSVMRQHGVNFLDASYSGGNDEGGVDEIEVMKDDRGEPVTIENLHWLHPLKQAVDSMLSPDFGSWAGEFSAHGHLFADVSAGRVWREGSYEVPQDTGGNWEY